MQLVLLRLQLLWRLLRRLHDQLLSYVLVDTLMMREGRRCRHQVRHVRHHHGRRRRRRRRRRQLSECGDFWSFGRRSSRQRLQTQIRGFHGLNQLERNETLEKSLLSDRVFYFQSSHQLVHFFCPSLGFPSFAPHFIPFSRSRVCFGSRKAAGKDQIIIISSASPLALGVNGFHTT